MSAAHHDPEQSPRLPGLDSPPGIQPHQTRHQFHTTEVAREVTEVIQSHLREIGQYLELDALPTPQASQATSLLHTDIAHLVQVANSTMSRHSSGTHDTQTLSQSMQRLIDLLFLSPAGLRTEPIPSSFWMTTETGRLLVRVLDWLERDDLVSALVAQTLPGSPVATETLEGTAQVQQRGHTLPSPFVKGLMGALIALFGYDGGTPELLQFSVVDVLPALKRWNDWLALTATVNPLCAYYRSDLGVPEPVDYAYLERLRQAISSRYPQGHTYLARQLGWHWWRTDYPLTRRWYSSYSLQHLVGSEIVRSLQHMTLPPPPTYPVVDKRFAWAEEQRVRTACRSFAHTLQNNAGIACKVKEGNRALLVRFPNCPFCANTMADCGILFGLVERMLLWLASDQPTHIVVRGQHIAGWSDITDGLIDVRPVDDDHHAVAVVFGSTQTGHDPRK